MSSVPSALPAPPTVYDSPALNCFELSIFGAGVGESLAVHLGQNVWLIVDSCIDYRTGDSAALSYLSTIGVDPNQVSNIVATHWHEDHVSGIDKLIAACTKARFHVPAAFRSEHLYKLIRAGAEQESLGTEALKTSKSFDKALAILMAGRRALSLIPTSSDKLLKSMTVQGLGAVNVTALSPSSYAEMVALQAFANFVQVDLPARRRPVAPDPNHTAIAIWIQWGTQRIVLGSDLVELADTKLGWKAAIACQVLAADPTKATVVKVPHHGSGNGHSTQFWAKHIQVPTAGLTTFAAGRSPPPKPSDIARLKDHCGKVYCAPVPSPPKTLKSKATSKFAKSQGIVVTPRGKRFGHIRIRVDPAGIIHTACFGDANQM